MNCFQGIGLKAPTVLTVAAAGTTTPLTAVLLTATGTGLITGTTIWASALLELKNYRSVISDPINIRLWLDLNRQTKKYWPAGMLVDISEIFRKPTGAVLKNQEV